MSLKATGMPVSGRASPRASRSSARRAWARLRSSSTVMNAFSSPFRRAMRARKLRVSSTEEIFRAFRAPESSSKVELSKLLDHLGDEVEAVLGRRRDGLIKLAPVGLAHLVG